MQFDDRYDITQPLETFVKNQINQSFFSNQIDWKASPKLKKAFNFTQNLER